MLQPGSDDFEGLVNQMQIMQSFIAPSEMLDRMDRGEQIPPEDIYAAAAQQYIDRVEEQRAQAQPQPPPARNLPFVTQPDPHEPDPDDSDDSEHVLEENSGSNENMESDEEQQHDKENQSKGEEHIDEAQSVPEEEQGDQALSQSMFRLYLASLTVQRDFPNHPSLHLEAAQRSSAADTVNPHAQDDAAAPPVQNSDHVDLSPEAAAQVAAVDSILAGIEEAQADATARKSTSQSPNHRQLPTAQYNRLSLMTSHGMLFPMPDNLAYLPMYQRHSQTGPLLDREDLITFQNKIIPIIEQFFNQENHTLRTNITEEDASEVFDNATLSSLAPLLNVYRARLRNAKSVGGGGGGGDYDGGDGDDDFDDLPDDDDEGDGQDDDDQMLNEMKATLKKHKERHEAFSACQIVVTSLLSFHATQGSLLRQCHLDARNVCRTYSEALTQLRIGKQVKVSSYFQRT